jgi:hypothetical protein
MAKGVREWYENHKDEYDAIREDLDKVNQKFLTHSKETQRKMLFTAYEFAVISIQTKVSIHEEAFRQLKNGNGIEESLSSVLYKNQKKDWIIKTRLKLDVADKVVNLLERGEIDKAHRLMVDEFTGVSTVKSAFTLSMLGFTSKACIDTNLKQFIGSDIEVYDGVVIDKYDKFCKEALDIDGIRELDLFMRQWVVFDFMRNMIERHKIYFEVQRGI